jgi:hypothetical protein
MNYIEQIKELLEERIDVEIAKTALPQIKELKKRGHGYPAGLSVKEWNKILDKIIWSMERTIDYGFFAYYDKNGKVKKRSPKQVQKLFKKQQEGYELFGKYFTSLWD